MAHKKFANVKLGQLKKLRDKAEDFDKVMEEVMKDYLNNLAMVAVAYAKENTMVITGILRGAFLTTAATKNDIVYSITIYNPTEYASFYEYGHRNPKGWTHGRFPLMKGISFAKLTSEETLKKVINKKLEELTNGK